MHTRRERAVIVLTNSLKARFFAKTAKKESGCIEWTGCVSPTGYGKFRLSDGPQDAHVVAWRMANGGIPVPVGKLVMHSCDNRQCVNAEHLSLGMLLPMAGLQIGEQLAWYKQKQLVAGGAT